MINLILFARVDWSNRDYGITTIQIPRAAGSHADTASLALHRVCFIYGRIARVIY
jgi:hypothetical protein